MLLYIVVIWNILRPLGIFPAFIHCTNKNLATLLPALNTFPANQEQVTKTNIGNRSDLFVRCPCDQKTQYDLGQENILQRIYWVNRTMGENYHKSDKKKEK
jgi:hypothetical protein